MASSPTFTGNFLRDFVPIIVSKNYQRLLSFYQHYPYVAHNVRIQGHSPLTWVFGKYISHTSQELSETELKIIEKVIEHSDVNDLNEIDDSGDSIMSYVFNLADTNNTYLRILKKLARYGYNFEKQTHSLDFSMYLVACHEDSLPIKKEIITFLLKHTTRETLNAYRQQIMNEVVGFQTYDEFKYVIEELKKKGMSFDRNGSLVGVMLSYPSFHRQSPQHQKKKLELMLGLGYELPPYSLSLVCRMPNQSLSVFQYIVKHMPHPIHPLQAHDALVELGKSHPYFISPEKIRIAKQLLDMGANVTKEVLTNAKEKNVEWVNLLYSYLPTSKLKRLRPSHKQLRQQHLSFRQAFQEAQRHTRAQQRGLRSVKSRPEPVVLLSRLPPDVKRQLQNMLVSRQQK